MLIERITFPTVNVDFQMRFDLNCPHDRHVWVFTKYGGGYEREICFLLVRALRRGDVAVDIGANFGSLTLLMSKLVGPDGNVLAFEPIKESREKLQDNLALNHATNVAVDGRVVAQHSGVGRFFLNSDDAAGSGLWNPGVFPGNNKSAEIDASFMCDQVCLDDLKLFNIRLLKIDAEGAEHAILKGGYAFIERARPPFIVVELNPFGMDQMRTNTEALRAYMSGFGYHLFFLHADGRLPTLVPPNTAVLYENGVVVKNALFADMPHVSEAWPEALE